MPMEKKITVNPLLKRLKDCGDERDFKLLYNLLYDKFFRIAIYFLKKEDRAQEVVSDVFLSLWNKREELPRITNFESYCFILLKNASLNYLEKHNRETEPLTEATDTNHSGETPESILMNDELLQIYVDAIEELAPRCHEVFIRVKEQGFSYKETAAQLGISVKTVDAQLQKALQSIKEKIRDYFS